MSLAEQIQKFLKEKFTQYKLTRKQFIQDTGFTAPTVSRILNAEHRNPEFKTILKIADYFNCSIDEVIGRNEHTTLKYKKFFSISLDQINANIKIFLLKKINEFGFNQYKLGKNLGFNEHIIVHFLKDKKSLGSPIIVALADYFKVSIDEMIGRVSPSNQEPLQTTEPNLTSKKQ